MHIGSGRRLSHGERRDRSEHLLRLRLQGARRTHQLLRHASILLRHRIHLRHRRGDLLDTGGLLVTGRLYLRDHLRHLFH